MNRREFVQVGALATVGATLDSRAQVKSTRFNVLYVFSDQHRAVSMPGEPYSQTIAPNLDAFRRQNFSMDNCISNYPLCTPYRGILMSGRWPQQTGLIQNEVALSAREISLGDTFRQAGYHTGYVGKWHLSGKSQAFIPPGPQRLGFEDWHVWNNTNAHYKSWTYDQVTGEKIQPKGWNCTLMTDEAVAFLQKQPANQPWFLMVSWNPPHPPFNPPAEDAGRYPIDGLKFRPNVRLAAAGQPVKGPARFLASQDGLREAEQGYYGGITGVDLEFARLLEALKESGQAENTIVIYTSDHGEMMGSQGRMAKQVPFEESCRVPFYVRIPGQKSGKSSALFAAIDIYPTLCGLTAIPVPPRRGGRDLSGVMLGQAPRAMPTLVFLMNQVPAQHVSGIEEPEGESTEDGKGTVMLVNQPSYRGVRTLTHTYAVMETGRWCLYDNVKDPYQMQNLVNDSNQGELMKQLDAEILRWLRSVNDPFSYVPALSRTSTFPA